MKDISKKKHKKNSTVNKKRQKQTDKKKNKNIKATENSKFEKKNYQEGNQTKK